MSRHWTKWRACPISMLNGTIRYGDLLEMEEAMKPTEKNVFTVIDIDEDKIVFSMYMWRPPQPVDEIDSMEPALAYEVARKW